MQILLFKRFELNKVSYYFPPYSTDIALNIKQKIIKEFQTITELKTVTVDLPFYKQITFWTTIASIFSFLLNDLSIILRLTERT